ncbi:uncharacterized protein LOC122512421 [Leptopilina heterotoma]|uniref:uncharacterized protein LOC122512421 n=1 Tax=Leptopilina heterotoma TaxID=63436 RepID=UPI001CA9873D|nr:uncharacterized protein LOC122512421 [Leptopilina heterotoma]
MSTIKRKATNNEASEQKRLKFSTDELIEELKTLENDEIKTGIINCNQKAIINVNNQKIDLQNIDKNFPQKLFHKNESRATNSKIIQLKIETINNNLLNYLGQSITNEKLGSKYQAIAKKLIIYRENDFRPPSNDDLIPATSEESKEKYQLIIICPTNCQGGNIYFPELKKKFIPTNDKMNYILFEKQRKYKLSKVKKNSRFTIIYKIIENSLDIQLNDKLLFNETENLQIILKNIREKNVLISLNDDGNFLQKICDDFAINYKEVYSDEECPNKVYDQLEDNEYEYYYLGWHNSDVDFGNFVENQIPYDVGKFLQITRPRKIFKPVVRYYNPAIGPKETFYDVDYYRFLLINPSRSISIEIENYQESQSDEEELDDEVWRINKYFSTIPF